MQTTQEFVFDVTTVNFPELVLARSAQVPVLVDFWASWCAPCRALGPVLEKAVAEKGGAVLLGKVDTDREAALAQHYRISGIPAVKAFRDGKVIDEFTGARDARFVRAFLDRLVPSKEAQAMDQALVHLRKGEAAAAEAILNPLLADLLAQQAPGTETATGQGTSQGTRQRADVVRIALAEAALAQGPAHFSKVAPLLDATDPRSRESERVDALRLRLAFYEAGQYDGGGEAAARAKLLSDPKDKDAQYALASALAQRGAYGEALETLIGLLARDRHYRDDGARKAMLLLFEQLGPDHDLVQEYRRRLQVVL